MDVRDRLWRRLSTEELLLLNCGVAEDSWESLGRQGDPVPNIHWKDWCWSWNSNTLATWYKELTHLKRPWCWERLKAGGEGDNRGWDGWMASLTQRSLSKLRELVMDREAWRAAVHEVAKGWIRLSHWTELKVLRRYSKWLFKEKIEEEGGFTHIWSLLLVIILALDL